MILKHKKTRLHVRGRPSFLLFKRVHHPSAAAVAILVPRGVHPLQQQLVLEQGGLPTPVAAAAGFSAQQQPRSTKPPVRHAAVVVKVGRGYTTPVAAIVVTAEGRGVTPLRRSSSWVFCGGGGKPPP